MQKFILITATFGVPLLLFMTLNDAVGTFYAPKKPAQLAYQVVEIEEVEDVPEPEAEPEPEPVEEVAAEDASTEEVQPVEEAAVEPEAEEAAPADDATEVSEEADLQVAALSEADMAAAAKAMRGCKSCHQWERERNGAGPHLVGVVGRAIGSVDGFRYSNALEALNEAGEVWTVDALQVWLEDPNAFAEGTKMGFKVRDAEDRRLIAEWLAANG